MTTLNHSRTTATTTPRRDRAGFLFLIAGGVAFFASGPLHPTGSDEGDKTEQLHSMLIDSAWYPAHLVALLGFACVAAGLLALGRDPAVRDRLGRLLPISATVAVVATLGGVSISSPPPRPPRSSTATRRRSSPPSWVSRRSSTPRGV